MRKAGLALVLVLLLAACSRDAEQKPPGSGSEAPAVWDAPAATWDAPGSTWGQ